MDILYVEDNVTLGTLVKETLEGLDHAIKFVTCVREAVRIIADDIQSLDLIITDVQLPTFKDSRFADGSGLEVLRAANFMRGDEAVIPAYVYSSEKRHRGKDIAEWLNEHYPQAVFAQKHVGNDQRTAQDIADFIATLG